MKINKDENFIGSDILSFFGTTKLPELQLDDDILKQIVIKNVYAGYNVTGVQKKLSLHLENERGERPRLTIVNYPNGYILKPQSDEYKFLPENEFLIMSIARKIGIDTVPFALIKLKDKSFAYITKRIDRNIKKNIVEKYAMEDFCQLSGRLTEDKYKSSYENCGKIINDYSINPGLDISEFFLRVCYSFVVGNTDMHLKNFSLIEITSKKMDYHLSKAYDLLSTKIVLDDKEDMALTIDGRKNKIKRKTFVSFGKNIGLNNKTIDSILLRMINSEELINTMIRKSYLPNNYQDKLINIVKNNITVIK